MKLEYQKDKHLPRIKFTPSNPNHQPQFIHFPASAEPMDIEILILDMAKKIDMDNNEML
jgi:hypothetical protein